jgi:putative Holliday junction resolvase
MRTLGIDWGEARIGLATSDPSGVVASPHGTVAEKDKGAQITRVVSLISELEVERIVVGMPFELDGTEGPMAQMAGRYASKLAEVTGLPVIRWDERLSSAAAERAIREMGGGRRRKGKRDKGQVDAIAACLLLQSFLDSTESR